MADIGWRRRLARLIQPTPRAEVDEELRFHLEERARELEARGMSPEAARAAARERMGDLDGVRDQCAELLSSERRSETRREWLRVSWLDFKLGFRMLAKYPGLTIIGGLSMAFAIWVGAGTFEFIRQVVDPPLPLAEGDRVVGMLLLDPERGPGSSERRAAYDFVRWRGELETIRQLGAFRTLDRNLIVGGSGGGVAGAAGQPVEVAEITASGFDVARVQPLMGRTLLPSDEEPGAPPVVVLGHRVWRERLGGDPDVVGQTVRLGTIQATVVGVMPEGFQFPIHQNVWTPLRRSILDQQPRQGPRLFMFGRLAPGASLDEAQAELATVGQRIAADHPETHENLRPRVLPYAQSIFYLPNFAVLGLGSVNLFMVMLLVLICGNVALLMFARAASRESELLVRTALGASRARIISQLFVEALVLGSVAAILGLGAAGLGLRWMYSTAIAQLTGTTMPFWFSPTLSTGTVVYAVILTLLAAVVAGVTPALKVTGPKVEARLKEMTAGSGGLRFGGVWTAVIVAQIAVTMVFPVMLFEVRGDARDIEGMPVNFPEEEYLAIRLEMDRDVITESASTWMDNLDEGPDPALAAQRDVRLEGMDEEQRFEARFSAAARELEQRLEARPDIGAVTFGERLPRMYHPHRLVDIDSGGAAPKPTSWASYRVSSVSVTPDYFPELQVAVQQGRGFHSGDLGENARTVVVNESFVQNVLGGRNPVGRRIKYMYFEEEENFRDPETEPWYEIVGVVPDLGLSWSRSDTKEAGIYHPVAPGAVYPTHMAVQITGAPGRATHAIRSVATTVDPALRLYDPVPFTELDDSELRFYSFWFWITLLVTIVATTLSLAGIYAAMSFAVSRRTREIGIRVALGAGRGRIVAAIFRRPLIQVALGLGVGSVILTALFQLSSGNVLTPGRIGFLVAYVLASGAICMLACVVPTRRALTVEPTDALRAEA